MSKNWQICQLGDVLTLINGRAYKKEEMLTEGVPILRIQNLNGGNKWFYSNLELQEDKYCYKNDLLYAWSATFGPYWSKWDHKLIYHYHIWKIETSPALNKQFAYYALWNITEALKASAHGVAMPHITKAGMEAWEIQLPPISEQKIIAEKLDTLLAQVESTKARLEQIPQILKRFRQAVLAIAVNGQLTKEWRELSELSAIWPSLTLGELVTIERGSSPRPIKNYITTSESGVNWIKIGDAREGEKYIHSTKEKITPEGAKKSRKVTPGDFILSNSMSLGRAYIVDIEGYVHDGWFILRLPQHIDKNYFYYLLSSSQLQEQFSNLAVGGVVQNIRSELVKQAIVNIPSEKEQREIVRRVEQLFAYADTIEKQVNNALARVNNLTQSILAKAFRGELTAQWRAENPDLISGENSAAALLEKIKAERAASGGKKASRKKS
ncbi:restriction endonuclease subunit S [Escherichia coli]|uniref:restriction endonuclease subunit S n=3 Tax=Escherichia coli TaxID=562 RepID=UPI0006A5822B|nr:restriction endonuclease subunit S [Escherichia coli]EES0673401.1 restriction endonuclease subunit S [Escherichia coli]EEU3604513.1 restriction endonuclease subunit S [Escherichia coli]EEZ2195316.1 restriction endonuclease subunit S [Escherichia coli]EFC2502481.1 restriction endonuclease subunit S [Escherichia coli]EFS2097465.1 restriction endonuclease subunit S [Escherichia coli]